MVIGKNITGLTGIEDFTAVKTKLLKEFFCSSIDVSLLPVFEAQQS